MTKKKQRNPPSRVKYEAKNPTISCRVSLDIYERLQDAKQSNGKSLTDILKIGLGLMEADNTKNKSEYKRGFADAMNKYVFGFPCSVCGDIIVVDTDEEKLEIVKYLRENAWGHNECIS